MEAPYDATIEWVVSRSEFSEVVSKTKVRIGLALDGVSISELNGVELIRFSLRRLSWTREGNGHVSIRVGVRNLQLRTDTNAVIAATREVRRLQAASAALAAAAPRDSLTTVLANNPSTIVRVYRGATQIEAAPALELESRQLADAGYRLTSQAWAAGERPILTGLAGLLLLLVGLFVSFSTALVGIGALAVGAILLLWYWGSGAEGTNSATFERIVEKAPTRESPLGPPRSVRERLRELDSLRDEGLITPTEYAARRTVLLDQI